MLIQEENNNILENFMSYKNDKSLLKEKNIEKDHRNLLGKSFNLESHIIDNISERIF